MSRIQFWQELRAIIANKEYRLDKTSISSPAINTGGTYKHRPVVRVHALAPQRAGQQ